MKILLGTTNKGKLAELSALLRRERPEWALQTLEDLPHYTQPPEDGKTFLDNARIKARSIKVMAPGQWVLAEDAGLEVEALGGLPGIHTARYAGPHARDSENIAKLLKMLQIRSNGNRKARFVCTIVAYDPQGHEHIAVGELPGMIGKNPVGQQGFGYDPIFVPEGETQSLAELGPAFKNRASHRARAMALLLPHLVG
jgi:XTP/dITP diphosphohydrolase